MVVNDIQQIVSALPGGPIFITGEKAYANLVSDNKDFSNGAVFLYRPLTITDTVQASGFERTHSLLMFFAFQHELLDTPEHLQEPTFDAAFNLSEQFLYRLQALQDEYERTSYKYIKNIKRTEVQNVYDVNLGGWLLQLDLVPFNYEPNCIV